MELYLWMLVYSFGEVFREVTELYGIQKLLEEWDIREFV